MKWLLALDGQFSEWLTIPQQSNWWRWARLIAHLGDGPYVFGGFGVAYLCGWFQQDPFSRQANLTLALIVSLAILIVTVIKFIVRRLRPHPPGEFVSLQYDLYSFPSGHSARHLDRSSGNAAPPGSHCAILDTQGTIICICSLQRFPLLQRSKSEPNRS